MEIIKAARGTKASDSINTSISHDVRAMLDYISQKREDAVREFASKYDNWDGDFVMSDAKRIELISQVPQQVRDDIDFTHKQVRRFADAQRASLSEFELETEPGVTLGQKVIPVQAAGCYVPGGRYAHAASAIMSIATAKAAGVPYVVACSPPRGHSIAPAVVYAMHAAGADTILQIGGVHAVASMAEGLFCERPVDILVGPGNAYVAEAKRLLFGSVGIDVFAGPTESAIIADASADPMTIAVDLVSQAEHGPTSPVWLFTTCRKLGLAVDAIMPNVIADMPNADVCAEAWDAHGEIIFAETKEELASISDHYACEHLQVMASDLDWWKNHLKNYGSLFLGEGSTVTHGDKCSGTNHILPTQKAARYSGGLNVQKFLKVLTYQELSKEANEIFSAVGSRISRAEGMEGHARACDWRLKRYFPETSWDFPVYEQKRYD